MSLIITNLRHYNTPTLEGIVQPSSDTGYRMDRLPYHKYHNRNGHWFSNYPESSESDRGRIDYNRRGHVRRSESLTPVQPGIASKGRGSRENISGASFPIWSCA